MPIKRTITRSLTAAGLLAAVASYVAFTSAATSRFFEDDPIQVERDTQDASRVKPGEVSLFVDLTYNLFGKPGDPTPNVRARNVNTVDEVPDSSWFTNRAGRRPIAADEVGKAANTGGGPRPGRWLVSSKGDGMTPGFTIRDSAGDRWFIKFDPPGYRAMGTGTEVTVSKLMWALGYNVTENHIAAVRREQLVPSEDATIKLAGGKPRRLRAEDIDRILEHANRDEDGSYRVIAARALEGTPLGGFRFFGTRPDDPNDLVPHEHRRELRGLGVFAAWVNLVDSKSGNMLDMLVKANGRAFVKHYVQDVGSTLGSGALAPAEYWEGYEYIAEPGMSLRQMLAFGFAIPRWRTIDLYESRAFGRLPRDNSSFDPEAWKPRFPNQAFLRARADDKFWAAQRLVAISDDMLRAAIAAGQFGDQPSEDFLVKALGERRDAIGRTYLTAINPIADPALDAGGVLTFRNAAVDGGFAKAPEGYRAVWSTFDNATGATRQIGDTSATAPRLEPPPGLSGLSGGFIRVELSATGGSETWQRPVRSYFRHRDGGWRLVGFERLPED